MGLFRKKAKKQELLFLSEKNMDSFEEMVSDKIGPFESIFHETASPDMHIDVIIVPPNEKNDYITLVTMGMSAYPMPVLSKYGRMNRAELAIRLPKEWEVSIKEQKLYWPVRILQHLARFPYTHNTWLGLYHSVDFGHPLPEETELCGVMLDIFDENIDLLTYENGDQVILYNVIPLFRSEMEYKNAEGVDALFEKMSKETLYGPVDIHRTPVV